MAHIAERYGSHYSPMFTGVQVTPLADAKALLGALTDVRPTIFGGVPRVWEKLKAGIETLVAYEPDQARRQAVQHAFRSGSSTSARPGRRGAGRAGPGIPAG